MPANLYALGAIALWATLSSLGLLLQHVPPFLLTGVALFVGSALTWPTVIQNRQAWAVSKPVLALGVITLFGFHFLLFMALRLAPAVEVNLVNYLWPLLIVVLSALSVLGIVGKSLATMDNMTAFSKSVNFTAAERELDKIKGIARQALADNEQFYRVFREAVLDAGKA